MIVFYMTERDTRTQGTREQLIWLKKVREKRHRTSWAARAGNLDLVAYPDTLEEGAAPALGLLGLRWGEMGKQWFQSPGRHKGNRRCLGGGGGGGGDRSRLYSLEGVKVLEKVKLQEDGRPTVPDQSRRQRSQQPGTSSDLPEGRTEARIGKGHL